MISFKQKYFNNIFKTDDDIDEKRINIKIYFTSNLANLTKKKKNWKSLQKATLSQKNYFFRHLKVKQKLIKNFYLYPNFIKK